MLTLAFHLLAVANLDEEISKSPVTVELLKELHDEEVGSVAELNLEFSPTEKDFLACVPQESIPFPKELSADLKAKIFTKEETKSLMECSAKECKFNFLPSELPEFDKAKSVEERKTLFFKLYQERITGDRGTDSTRSSRFLRSRDHAFEDCENNTFSKLLNERPASGIPFRLSVVQYEDKMKPTTRLLQGTSWRSETAFCYGEALIFSNHYDVDRVEVWSMKKVSSGTALKFQLRNRIDLLNTWARRLSKGKFRNQSREIVFRQMSKVATCLNAQRKVNVGAKPADAPAASPKKK